MLKLPPSNHNTITLSSRVILASDLLAIARGLRRDDDSLRIATLATVGLQSTSELRIDRHACEGRKYVKWKATAERLMSNHEDDLLSMDDSLQPEILSSVRHLVCTTRYLIRGEICRISSLGVGLLPPSVTMN
jgi:hypothetical protein